MGDAVGEYLAFHRFIYLSIGTSHSVQLAASGRAYHSKIRRCPGRTRESRGGLGWAGHDGPGDAIQIRRAAGIVSEMALVRK